MKNKDIFQHPDLYVRQSAQMGVTMKSMFLTGALGGLGKALTEVYLQAGYRVYGGDLVKDEKIYEGLRDAYGSCYELFNVDVSGTDSVAALARDLKKHTDTLDVIINAAGILPPNSAKVIEDFDIDQALKVFDINTLGPLRITKALLDFVEKSEDKLIINISSEAGSLTAHNPNYINRYDYCMSKAGVNMQTVLLQRYLKPRNIKMLAIHPGWMKTGMGGANATVEPIESARGIYNVGKQYTGRTDAGIFFDYDGKPRTL